MSYWRQFMWLSVRLRKVFFLAPLAPETPAGQVTNDHKPKQAKHVTSQQQAPPVRVATPETNLCGLIRTVSRSMMAPSGRKRKNRSSRQRSSNAVYRNAFHATG